MFNRVFISTFHGCLWENCKTIFLAVNIDRDTLSLICVNADIYGAIIHLFLLPTKQNIKISNYLSAKMYEEKITLCLTFKGEPVI